MKYRDHRGSLEASMLSVREMPNRAALVEHLRETYGRHELVRDDLIEVKHYCYDERIGWDTWIVTLNGGAVGFTDGPL